MTASTTAPTPLDVERYIQLNALWLVMGGGLLGETFNALVPDLELDNLDIVATIDGEPVSHRALFARVFRDREDDEGLLGGRLEFLVARMLRAIDPQKLASEAAHFDTLASVNLRAAGAAGA
jgi:hypothetical protein